MLHPQIRFERVNAFVAGDSASNPAAGGALSAPDLLAEFEEEKKQRVKERKGCGKGERGRSIDEATLLQRETLYRAS